MVHSPTISNPSCHLATHAIKPLQGVTNTPSSSLAFYQPSYEEAMVHSPTISNPSCHLATHAIKPLQGFFLQASYRPPGSSSCLHLSLCVVCSHASVPRGASPLPQYVVVTTLEHLGLLTLRPHIDFHPSVSLFSRCRRPCTDVILFRQTRLTAHDLYRGDIGTSVHIRCPDESRISMYYREINTP